MSPRAASALSIAGIALLIVSRLLSALLIDSDACTQGADDGLRGAYFINAVVSLPAIAFLCFARASSVSIRALAFQVGLLAFAWHARLAFATVLAGHHPCGADYDSYQQYLSPVDWAALPVMSILDLAVAVSALTPLLRRRASG
jgi:hypothetical protein